MKKMWLRENGLLAENLTETMKSNQRNESWRTLYLKACRNRLARKLKRRNKIRGGCRLAGSHRQ